MIEHSIIKLNITCYSTLCMYDYCNLLSVLPGQLVPSYSSVGMIALNE